MAFTRFGHWLTVTLNRWIGKPSVKDLTAEEEIATLPEPPTSQVEGREDWNRLVATRERLERIERQQAAMERLVQRRRLENRNGTGTGNTDG